MTSQTDFLLKDKLWSLRLPEQPDHVLVPATLDRIDDFLRIMSNPENNLLTDTRDKVWDDEAIATWKERVTCRITSSEPNCMELLVLHKATDSVHGTCGLYGWSHETHSAVAGVVLDSNARCKGLGAAILRSLIQLAFNCGLRVIEIGTMRVNLPMRRVLSKLGGVEVEKIVNIPGRGVVAEIECTFLSDEWSHGPLYIIDDPRVRTDK